MPLLPFTRKRVPRLLRTTIRKGLLASWLKNPVAVVLLAHALFLGLPTFAYVAIGYTYPPILGLIHYAIATAYAITSLLMLYEARAAVSRRRAPISPDGALPKVPLVSVIVSAYLPNEQELIAETIVHLATQMRVPSYRLQIILAYNTPHDLPVERGLESFRRLNVAFTPLRVQGSRSKAENIMAALPYARGEMTVLLDGDHHPHPDAIERAWRWLSLGYDVVQGRCVIRNQMQSYATKLVAVEFEQMYSVFHPGRSHALDTAIFGGTNGYWRTSALKQIGMDHRMLTEDIDSSLRALLAGYKLIHDRSIISTELAPATFGVWWNQRLRWAQGWFQVTMRHQTDVWRSPHLSMRLKFYWTLLLGWRELFPLLSLQIPGLLIAAEALGQKVDLLASPYLVSTAILTLLTGPLTGLAAYRMALWRTKQRLKVWFLIYAFMSLPYTGLRNTVALVAIIRELLGESRWVVTKRALLEPKTA